MNTENVKSPPPHKRIKRPLLSLHTNC